MPSAVWSGYLHFGLVAMPVRLLVAARTKTTRFRLPRSHLLKPRHPGAAMLSGVWISGGVFMTLAGLMSGSGLIGGSALGQAIVVVLSVIPIVTYIMATADSSAFALLGVTIGALLVCGLRASFLLLRSPQGPGTSWVARAARHH